jgi:hypothetical protein
MIRFTLGVKWVALLLAPFFLAAGCAFNAQSIPTANMGSTPSSANNDKPISLTKQSVSEDAGKDQGFTVASILAKEPLQGNLSRRYIMQTTRNAFGAGTGEAITRERDFINCWLFDGGAAVKQCDFREFGEKLWNDIRAGQPGQSLQTAYVHFSIVPDKSNNSQARILIFETYTNPLDEHYWVMTISNMSGTWRKDSLTRHPLPFPSTW